MANEKTSRAKSPMKESAGAPTDVVLAESETPTDVRPAEGTDAATDVRLAEAVSDVQLVDSMSESDVALADADTGRAPSFRVPTPPAVAKTLDVRLGAPKPAATEKPPMALLP